MHVCDLESRAFWFLRFHFVCADAPVVPKAAATDKTTGGHPASETRAGAGRGRGSGCSRVFRQSVSERQGTEMRRGCYPPLSLGGASTASAFESLTEPKSVTKDPAYALLFDCDGVIVLTEELHRKAYNGAFEHFNLKIKGEPVVWTEEYYDILQVTYVRQWVGVPLFRPAPSGSA